MTRATTAYVSKHFRSRIWQGQFVRGEEFSLSANFNGCLGDATIASVIWRVNENQSVILGSAAIDGNTVSVQCTAGVGWGGMVKCQVTASDGKVWNQLFAVGVCDQPWFDGEAWPTAGALSASA